MTNCQLHLLKLWGGRFTGAPDQLAYQFNASLPFDRRLWAQDIRGSQAWAAALARAGVLTTAEAAQLGDALRDMLDPRMR